MFTKHLILKYLTQNSGRPPQWTSPLYLLSKCNTTYQAKAYSQGAISTFIFLYLQHTNNLPGLASVSKIYLKSTHFLQDKLFTLVQAAVFSYLY